MRTACCPVGRKDVGPRSVEFQTQPQAQFFSRFHRRCQTMATVLPTMPAVRRSLSGSRQSIRIYTRAYSHYPRARRRCPSPQFNSSIVSKKCFSLSTWRKFADVDSSFDPRQQDRESDVVDVCIVGGGTWPLLIHLFRC